MSSVKKLLAIMLTVGAPPTEAEEYPDDDPSKKPIVRWRSVAHLLFANWLNYYVYQETPYEIDRI